MATVREHGTPRVDDPNRLDGVEPVWDNARLLARTHRVRSPWQLRRVLHRRRRVVSICHASGHGQVGTGSG